jgi:hypothetical protein
MTDQFKTYEVETRATVHRTYHIKALTEEEAEDHHLMGELVDEQFEYDDITDTTRIEDE